jgi:hypothetical protein
MRLFQAILTLQVLIYRSALSSSIDRQYKLSELINETLNSSGFITPYSRDSDRFLHSNESVFQEKQCHSNVANTKFKESTRIGCCQAEATRYLYNVKLEKGKFIMFTDKIGKKRSDMKLPSIVSSLLQISYPFNMDVEERYSASK